MYKVIIADDEKRICALIQALVNWKDLNLELVATASDGRDAMEKALQFKPDIMITDVKMPEMDGIELLAHLDEQGICPKVIIISGYAEFEYAQAAIRYGVQNYLLKPIQKDELNKSLLKIKQTLDEEKQIENHLEKILTVDEQLKASENTLRNQITQMISEGESPAHQETILSNLCYRMILFTFIYRDLLPSREALDITNMAVQVLYTSLQTLEPGFFATEDRVWCLAQYKNGMQWEETVRRAKEALSQKIFVYGEVLISTSAEHKELTGKMAEEGIRARYWQWKYPLQEIIRYENLPKPKDRQNEKEKHAIVKAIELLDISAIEKAVRSYTEEMTDTDPDFFYYKMLSIWKTFCEINKQHGRPVAEEKERQNEFALRQCQSEKELSEKIVQLMKSEIEVVLSQKTGQEDYYVRSAKQYIHEHLSDCISLSDVAATIFISPVYLSTLFKQNTGVNFKDYVIDTRINEAKRLLIKNLNMTIAQIGEAVGYPDQQYFSKLFTRIVGLKPSDFRKLYR